MCLLIQDLSSSSSQMASHASHTALLQVTRALHIAKSADHFSVLIFWDLVGADDLVGHALRLEMLFSLSSQDIPPAWFSSLFPSCSFPGPLWFCLRHTSYPTPPSGPSLVLSSYHLSLTLLQLISQLVSLQVPLWEFLTAAAKLILLK